MLFECLSIKLIRSKTASEGKLVITVTTVVPKKEILYLSLWKSTCQLEAWQLSRKKITRLFLKVHVSEPVRGFQRMCMPKIYWNQQPFGTLFPVKEEVELLSASPSA